MRSAFSWIPLVAGMTVLVLSLAVAVLTVSFRGTGTTTSQDIRSQAAQVSGSMSLSPANGSYTFSSGQAYPVGIVLDSAGKSADGVDVVINFDPKKVQVVGANLSPTTLFERVVINKVDNVSGQIKFSALTFDAKPVTGILATFRFQPLTSGKADFVFVYSPGATNGSIIAEHGTAKNILGKVENGTYVFK